MTIPPAAPSAPPNSQDISAADKFVKKATEELNELKQRFESVTDSTTSVVKQEIMKKINDLKADIDMKKEKLNHATAGLLRTLQESMDSTWATMDELPDAFKSTVDTRISDIGDVVSTGVSTVLATVDEKGRLADVGKAIEDGFDTVVTFFGIDPTKLKGFPRKAFDVVKNIWGAAPSFFKGAYFGAMAKTKSWKFSFFGMEVNIGEMLGIDSTGYERKLENLAVAKVIKAQIKKLNAENEKRGKSEKYFLAHDWDNSLVVEQEWRVEFEALAKIGKPSYSKFVMAKFMKSLRVIKGGEVTMSRIGNALKQMPRATPVAVPTPAPAAPAATSTNPSATPST